jgi:hypothetical protein
MSSWVWTYAAYATSCRCTIPPRSPLWAYPRSDEVRFTYVFDPEGWVLFQSEDPDREDQPLSTYLPRAGMEGTLGRPGLDVAFRPDTANADYWRAVAAVREDQAGLLHVSSGGSGGGKDYAPWPTRRCTSPPRPTARARPTGAWCSWTAAS